MWGGVQCSCASPVVRYCRLQLRSVLPFSFCYWFALALAPCIGFTYSKNIDSARPLPLALLVVHLFYLRFRRLHEHPDHEALRKEKGHRRQRPVIGLRRVVQEPRAIPLPVVRRVNHPLHFPPRVDVREMQHHLVVVVRRGPRDARRPSIVFLPLRTALHRLLDELVVLDQLNVK
ncbi:hypothetical protein B0H13DRAFT_2453918 [Mycena leptocephala]|nr:hypothetical protein B0H13DRAFT_2453918 [Mycena leptocephala]